MENIFQVNWYKLSMKLCYVQQDDLFLSQAGKFNDYNMIYYLPIILGWLRAWSLMDQSFNLVQGPLPQNGNGL